MNSSTLAKVPHTQSKNKPTCSALAQERRPDAHSVAAVQAQQEGRIADAEKILLDAIHAGEQTQPTDPQLPLYLSNLAGLYELKNQHAEAIAAAQRALELDQKSFGPTSNVAAGDLANIAGILQAHGETAEAERILKQAVEATRQNSKPDPTIVSQTSSSLAFLYSSEKRWAEAAPLYEEAIKACELVPNHNGLCDAMRRSLAAVYRNEGRAVDAEQLAPVNLNIPLNWQRSTNRLSSTKGTAFMFKRKLSIDKP
jgi:tetratricopeptide (TPR) repeat protein